MPQSTEPGQSTREPAASYRLDRRIPIWEHVTKRHRFGNSCMRNALHNAAALLLFSVLLVARDTRAQEPSPPPPDIQSCLVTKPLPQEARTELLPDGVCPIRINQRCFDKSYGLAVSNKCGTAIRIQVEAGTRGKYGSSTGEYTLRPGDNTGFRCLQANGGCRGVQARVLSFAQAQGTARPRAAMLDGGSSEVFFVREGAALPNQFGGTDLYYLKGDHWFVRRTKTKPQAPDYIADESVEFYGNKDGFYARGSSGETWWVRPGPPSKGTPPIAPPDVPNVTPTSR
jgi:hypothetical protein